MPSDNKKSKQSTVPTEPADESIKAANSMKWIFLFLLITGVALLSESLYKKSAPLETKIEMQSRNHFVSRDLNEMYKKGQIPKYFFQLKNIKWSYYDEELKTQIPEESIPFKASEAGAYNLEVDAFSSPQKKSKIAVLQMSLIEVKSGNKVWELSRNYEIQNTK